MNNVKKKAKKKLIETYKKNKGIIIKTANKKEDVFFSSLKDSLKSIKYFLNICLIIWGIAFTFPIIQSHILIVSYVTLSIVLIGCIAFCGYSYIKFSKRIYKREYENIEFEIKIEDYIVNMIDLLLEYKNSADTRLIFAIGMNETVLERIVNTSKEDNSIYECLVSVCRDFMDFMCKFLGINALEPIRQELKQKNNIPKIGNVFTVDYEIKGIDNDYKMLNETKFTVIYYVNSASKRGVSVEENATIVEDGRETVIHLIDKLSDYLYEERKGNNNKFILMIPAIGTGKTGKAPYRNILIEIINFLSISGYQMPNRVVLSLRDFELFSSGYEISSLLRLAKQLLKSKKNNHTII